MTSLVHETLKIVPLFAELTDEELDAIAATGELLAVAPPRVLFRQGDPGDSFYVVIDGAVQICKEGGGQELDIGTMRRGEFFGEMSLLDNAPRSATVRVIEPSRLFRVSHASYMDLLSHSPHILHALLHQLTKHLRQSNLHRMDLAQERDAVRAHAELDRLRALSQMVAGVAHELNTPLGIIRNAASLVTELLTPASIPSLSKDAEAAGLLSDAAAACQLVQKNIDHAARLVQSFKSLSVRQITDAREIVDLCALVREVLGLYRLKAQASRLELRFESSLAPGQQAWDGFPGYLTQVLLNLVTNADRYAYPNGEGGVVEVTLATAEVRPGTPGFELVVRDWGSGIAPADLPKIFEPFFTTGRDRDGTGLGLAIVHNIVTHALGGTIRADSQPGKGAAFFLRCPTSAPAGGMS